jgi:hypothetical protein
MSDERAILWLIVAGLMGAGLLLGQAAAISVAAAVAVYLVYEGMKTKLA